MARVSQVGAMTTQSVSGMRQQVHVYVSYRVMKALSRASHGIPMDNNSQAAVGTRRYVYGTLTMGARTGLDMIANQ